MDGNPVLAGLMYVCMALMGIWIVFKLLSLLVLAIIDFVAHYWPLALVIGLLLGVLLYFLPDVVYAVRRMTIRHDLRKGYRRLTRSERKRRRLMRKIARLS